VLSTPSVSKISSSSARYAAWPASSRTYSPSSRTGVTLPSSYSRISMARPARSPAAGSPGDLASAGLLESDKEGYRFRHPLLQEAAYEEVPAGRRHALHDQIAAAMANSGRHPAAHLEQADRPEAALSAIEAAAGEARRAGHAGRMATLRVVAFQLAGRHRSLAGRGPALSVRR
jgi:hypothetical protein